MKVYCLLLRPVLTCVIFELAWYYSVYWGFKTNILILMWKICLYHTEFFSGVDFKLQNQRLSLPLFLWWLIIFICRPKGIGLGSSHLCLWRKQSPGKQHFVTCNFQSRDISFVDKYRRGLHLAMWCLQFWHFKKLNSCWRNYSTLWWKVSGLPWPSLPSRMTFCER